MMKNFYYFYYFYYIFYYNQKKKFFQVIFTEIDYLDLQHIYKT